MNPYHSTTTWISLLTITLTMLSAQASNNRILIKTVASEEYVRERATNEDKKIQTYNFFQGRYFPGNIKNRSMERFTFMDVLENMAVHLQTQGYYNHPRLGEADLLIVVHYGVTENEESFFDMMGYTSLEDLGYAEDMDASALAEFQFNIQIMESMNQDNERSRYGKAQLLGMEEAYMRSTPPYEREDLEWMLTESRYFVILMAYDLPLLQQGERKLLWSTRYSIRSIGQPFDEAIKDMNRVAADYFGQNLKGLQKRRANDESRVIVGDIEVVGQEQE